MKGSRGGRVCTFVVIPSPDNLIWISRPIVSGGQGVGRSKVMRNLKVSVSADRVIPTNGCTEGVLTGFGKVVEERDRDREGTDSVFLVT